MPIQTSELMINVIKAFNDGRYLDSSRLAKQILKIDPENIRAKEFLAYSIGSRGDKIEALKILWEISFLPQCSLTALFDCGSLLLELGHYNKAILVLEKLLISAPDSFEVLHDLATAYAQVGRRKEALEKYHLALLINPNCPELFYNIGRVYDELHQEVTAIEYYRKTLELDDKFSKSWLNMGLNFNYLGKYESGLKCLNRSLELDPGCNFLLGEVAHTQMNLGDWSGFNSFLEMIISGVNDGKKVIHPFHLLSLVDSPNLHRSAAKIYSSEKYVNDKSNFDLIRSTNKKIRVGYFSADFRNHATAHLMAEAFELHDKNRFELIAFSYGLNEEDGMRQRLRHAFDQFIDISEISDDDAVAIARSKELDIAVDLSGHTQDSRTGIFSRRVSTVQVNYLAYPGTMSTGFHDYIIADEVIVPKEFEYFYSEKVMRLPSCYQPNDTKKIVSNRTYSRSELGLPESGFIYCCFNATYKITPLVFNSWMKILKSVDRSVLWLLGDNEVVIQNLKKEADLRGVDSNRLIFAPKIPHAEHLARQKSASLFLDTFPYNAHTTASDSLWVGLPVITKQGKSFASRVASSILCAMDLQELIVDSDQKYIDLAIELALNDEKLGSLKRKMEINKVSSALFNTKLFIKSLEDIYLQIVR